MIPFWKEPQTPNFARDAEGNTIYPLEPISDEGYALLGMNPPPAIPAPLEQNLFGDVKEATEYTNPADDLEFDAWVLENGGDA